uniref:Hedgehog/Intein (Hint) domain-containing protein n=1 Tax=viral metagenome TaxID=1070528 RepID=A0A6C0BUZ9_9ZZZZ
MASPLELTYVFLSGFTLVLPIFNGTITSINWGDGNTTYNTGDYTADKTHVYSSGGTYNVSILGTSITQMSYVYGNGTTGAEYLSECNSFGEIGLTSLYFAFYVAYPRGQEPILTKIPSSLPTLSTITNMQGLFQYSSSSIDYTSITGWDVSGVQDMQAAFNGSNMNVDISGWDVSNVQTMRFIFYGATLFNQPLNSWNTGNVVNMNNMFGSATSFNQPLDLWDVSKVEDMSYIFANATSFNQDLSNWDVSSVTNANGMFISASSFNNGGAPGTSINPLSWGSTTGNFTNISSMFSQTNNFNQDISDWDVSKVTNVRQLFVFNNVFNQNLNNWSLTSLSDATLMFYAAFAYNNGGVTLDWTGKTPNLTNMNSMFSATTLFNQIVLLDTANVTNMDSVFSSAQAFNQDISNWDFSSVTEVGSMFNNSLFNYDVSSWNITSLTNMRNMFLRATAFNNGDVPFTGTFLNQISNVTNMRGMFYEAPAFNQDISGWDVSNVTDMREIFQGATAFNNNDATLNWGSKTSKVTNMVNMFYGATLFNQNISGWDVSSVTDMRYMFYNTSSFNQPITWADTSKVTTMYGMFYGANSFNQDISGWDVSGLLDTVSMFQGASAFNNGGVTLDWGSKTTSLTSMQSMFQDAASFNVVVLLNTSNILYLSNVFNGASSFNKSLNSWDVSNVQDMVGMFGTASSFNQPLDLWDVSSVTDMTDMFYNATDFNQDISGWDVSSVESMVNMFYEATNFNNAGVDLTWGINTSNVIYMSNMFQGATNFNVNISDWNISSVSSMNSMFQNATSFNKPLGSWDVTNVQNFGYMFYGASSFNQDLSTWNISNNYSMDQMLSYSFLSTTNYNNALNYWAQFTYTGYYYYPISFGGYGLVYSSASSVAHDTLSNATPPYVNWIFFGDAYVSTDTIKQNTAFSLSINAPLAVPEFEIVYLESGDYQLYYNDAPFSDVVTYDNTVETTIEFTDLIFSLTGTSLPLVLKYTSPSPLLALKPGNLKLGDPDDIATYYFDVYSDIIVCFKEDSKILTNKGYIPIQDLRKGDLIQTVNDGFKAINMIGKKEIHHPAVKDKIKDQLYLCSQNKYPQLFEDLVITGCHSILVKSFKDDEQRDNTIKLTGHTYVTDQHYRLPACLDEKTVVYEKEGIYTIYHLALDHDNYYMNYGIYANGLLVETCSQRYMKELSEMTLIE